MTAAPKCGASSGSATTGRDHQGVFRVFEVTVTGALALLSPDPAVQGDRPHPVRGEVGEVQRDAAAHREPDHLELGHPEPREHVPRVRRDRVVRQPPGGPAERREVWNQHPEPVRDTVPRNWLPAHLTSRLVMHRAL